MKRMFDITEEQEVLRGVMADFSQTELVPKREELASCHDFSPEHYWQIRNALSSLGVLALGVPGQYGGDDDTDSILASIPAEEVAAVDLGFSHNWTSNSLVEPTLIHYGTEEQKQAWLPGLASGEKIGAYCQTEPDNGSDVSGLKCWAEDMGDGKFVLTGTASKIFVSMGATDEETPADVLLVIAKTSKTEKPHKSLSMLLVDGKRAFEKGQLVIPKLENKVGAHQTATVEFAFNNCEAELIGEKNKGFVVAMNALTASRVGVAVQATGIAKGAYRIAYPYATETRTQFGQTLSELSAPAQYLKEMRAKIIISDVLSRRALVAKDEHSHADGEKIVYEASTAKRVNAPIATEVADRAVQIFGGHGYILENIVASIWASARLLQIYEGTDEIQDRLIFGDVLKRGGKYLGKLLLLKKTAGLNFLYKNEVEKVAEKWPFSDYCTVDGKYKRKIIELREKQLDNWVAALSMPEELKGVENILKNRDNIKQIMSSHLEATAKSASIPYALHANAYSHAFLDGVALMVEAAQAGYYVGNGGEKIEITEEDIDTALQMAENKLNWARSYS